jgi:hypothetical protein
LVLFQYDSFLFFRLFYLLPILDIRLRSQYSPIAVISLVGSKLRSRFELVPALTIEDSDGFELHLAL